MGDIMRRRILMTWVLTGAMWGCGFHTRPPLDTAKLTQLWEQPVDLEQRDLYYGPAGSGRAPSADKRYNFISIKETGTQPGYNVKDDQGREWSVKQGVESRIEVVVSRLVWAVGYHQPDIYYLPQWTLARDGRDTIQPAGRFRLESAALQKTGEWSWRNNPFLGSRQIAGLFVLMVMVNNWDLKTAQNALYESADGTATPRYVVRDLGAGFGRTWWFSLGTKDDPKRFEKEPFLKSITDG